MLTARLTRRSRPQGDVVRSWRIERVRRIATLAVGASLVFASAAAAASPGQAVIPRFQPGMSPAKAAPASTAGHGHVRSPQPAILGVGAGVTSPVRTAPRSQHIRDHHPTRGRSGTSSVRGANRKPVATATPVVPVAASQRNPVSTAVALAEIYWGAVPCGGEIDVVANAPLAAGLDPSTDGWVTFNSSLGPDDLTAPSNTYTNCTITLAHWQWPTWAAMENDWGMFCLTMTHEMGHLLGHKHSLAPRSVMAPVFTSDTNVPSLCTTTWLPGRRRAASQPAPMR